MFVKCLDGVVNLDLVRQVQAMSDGTARFYLDETNFAVIDFGSTAGEAQAGVEKLTQSVDPAIYI